MAITFTNLVGDWRRIVEDYVTDPANAADSPGVEGTITVTPVLGEGRHAPRGVPADGIFYTLDSLDLRVYRGLLRDPNMNADIKVAIEIDGYPVAWRASFDLQYRRVRIPLHDVIFGPNEIVDGQISLSSLVARDGVPPEYEGSYVQLMDAVAQAAAARDAAEGHADRAEGVAAGVEDAAQIVTDNVDAINDLPANIDAVNAARSGAEDARDEAQGHAGDASAAASAAASSASDAAGSASAAEGHAQDASSSASAAAGSASDASASAQAAAGNATVASDGAQTVTDNLDAIEAAPGAAQAAGDARDAAEGYASDASGSASAAAQSAADADAHRAAAAVSETAAGQSASDADAHRVAAGGHAGDAATALSGAESARDLAQQAQSGAEDERVIAEDAAALAEGHAQAADGHRVDAEAAAALAQSLRWVVKGAWEPGSYEAGDVVVWEERAYYAQIATDVEPPAQPWIPLTPAGGGGASHWDDLDGKPSVFPPEAHGHDAADVTGEATPNLDVTEASVGGQSIGEALDATTDASRLEGALTDQVDASDVMVTLDASGIGGPSDLAMQLATFLLTLYSASAEVQNKADIGHTHTIGDTDGLQAALDERPTRDEVDTALDGKADIGHTHPVTDLTMTGTASASTFARGDGTWATPPNTTYSTMSQAEAENSASTTARLATGQRLHQAVAANPRVAAAPATWKWDGTSLPTSASEVHAQARVGDFIVAPNLDTDPGWHQITGV